ncbi:globin domain-containing protein [Bosea vestrisii]|uniref:globin domain-containing protein n=1 Tax=Bosea vestrisii TaxID=151416 RepID=UPI0024DFCD29|nr:globin domain-containing protein [Bosea vestrisii]WID95914.1 globin domain-containing protein [Bosea vestrisii]
MTPQDIALVRSSFAQLHRRKIETACLFYERLFTTTPSTRVLFKTDIQGQAAKLMETLTVALAMLNDPGGLNVLLARLGERHRNYGVRPEHYEAVRSALLWTLETSLGRDFTVQTRAAWTELYDQMAKTMLAAAPPSRQSA